ncbi:hypothetical protein [Haloferula luteola]|nr:hypothetical protein [Haloferula luteola]
MTGPMAVVLGAVLILLVGVLVPYLKEQRKVVARTRGIGNCKQIGMYLIMFDQEFGKFPDEGTAAEVSRSTRSDLDFSGRSSNAIFRQLVAIGAENEMIFYCEHPEGSRRPDGRIDRDHALEPGETGFSYVVNLSFAGDPQRTILASPMVTSKKDRFDAEPYRGHAITLRIDGSVVASRIDESGRALEDDGKSIFESGPRTVWGEMMPEIWQPEFR